MGFSLSNYLELHSQQKDHKIKEFGIINYGLLSYKGSIKNQNFLLRSYQVTYSSKISNAHLIKPGGNKFLQSNKGLLTSLKVWFLFVELEILLWNKGYQFTLIVQIHQWINHLFIVLMVTSFLYLTVVRWR